MPSEHPFRISGVFADAADAERALARLREALPEADCRALDPAEAVRDRDLQPATEGVRDTLVRDTALGAGVGAATGAATAGALAAGGVALVLASPVAAALLALGYGAAIGSLGGAAKGLRVESSVNAAMLKDAIDDGYAVVVVHLSSEEELDRAQAVLEASAAETVVDD